MNNDRAMIGKITLLITATIVSVGVAEVAVRSFYFVSPGSKVGEECRSYSLYTWVPPFDFFEEVDRPLQLGYVHKPGSAAMYRGYEIKINSQGLRDREYSVVKPPNTYRIAVLGDSVTFGFGVAADMSYPEIIERKLLNRATGKNVEVINFSVTSYNSRQELILLKEKALAYKPDLIILGYHLNDIHPLWTLPVPSSTVSFFRGHSYLFNCAFNTILSLDAQEVRRQIASSYKELYGEGSETWHSQVNVLEGFAQVSKDTQTPLLVVLLPIWEDLNNYPFKGIHALLGRTMQAKGLYVLDMLSEVENLNGLEYTIDSKDPHHPNADGHERIAEAIYAKLIKEGLLPSPIHAGE